MTDLDSFSEEQKSEETLRELRKSLTAANKKLEKSLARNEVVYDAVREAFASFAPTITAPPLPKKTGKGGEEIAVLHVSDTQIGKNTISYNPDVARDRLRMLARKVDRITEQRRGAAKINECRLYLGGDIVEGEDIFPGQSHEIAQPVIDQACVSAPSALAELIVSLLGTFKRVRVCCVRGNHGRNSRHASRHTNWDTVAYIVLEQMLSSLPAATRKRVEIIVERERFWHVDYVFDWGNLIVHGDQIRGGYGGLPWYGVTKKAGGWIDSIPLAWDYLWFGHFHTPAMATVNHRIWLCNGTTESDNEYAQEQLAACGHPAQRLSFFSASHGLVSDNMVYLGDEDARIPQASRAEIQGMVP